MEGVLDGFGDAARLEAAGADVGVLRAAVDDDADTLQIGLEPALGGAVGVAAIVAHHGGLAAGRADFGHGGSFNLIAEQSR